MTIILNGTSGITFPDGTTQVDGLATPVPVADGGTGASTSGAAPFALKGANSDITSLSGLTTALSVAQGGTGAATLTANNVLLGNGTSALQAVAPGSSGNVLTSNGTTWSSSAPPSSTPTTAQVLSATAGATGGAVGTYSLCGSSSTSATLNSTYSASGTFYYMDSANGFVSSPSGTWRAMGAATSGAGTVMLRIA